MTYRATVCALSLLAAVGASTAFAQSPNPEPAPGASSTTPAAPAAPATTPAAATTVWAAAKAQAEAATAAYNAQKAAAEAKKAAIDADTAAKTAKNGTVTGQTGITGAIQAGTDGPKAEALLLASRAALSAGRVVKADLTTVFESGPYSSKAVLIITSDDQLAGLASTNFDIRRALLKAQLDAAHSRFQQVVAADYVAPPPKPGAAGSKNRIGILPALSIADQVIGDITKIGSWFQSDYSFGQVTVDVAADLYAASVVRAFRDGPVHPKFYSATHITSAEVPQLVADLTVLQNSDAAAAADQALAVKMAADRRAQAADDKDHAVRLVAAAARYEAFATATGKIVDATDAFLTGLFTETATAPAPIVKIAQDREVQHRLAEKPLVLLVTGKSVAAYYTKKNLWTFLGGPPLYTMGGANIVYKLFDPETGYEITHGVAPVHGGYRSVSDVERLFPAP
jgi:hypothetical protein